MAVYPLLKFVTSVTAAPTVLLDLNDGNLLQLKRDGFSVGVPTYDGDPLSVGVRWGYRTLSMNLQCYGTNAAAMAEYGLLAQQITAETNLLMFQLDASSSPIFFTTYRTAPSEIMVDQVVTDGGHTKSYWDVSVSLLAEPFAYGLRQDLTAVVMANDPLAGTNPMNATLGTVIGDVPTPAYIYRTGGTTVGLTELLGIDHAAATTGVPPIYQAESGTNGTDTANVAVGGTSGGNIKRVTFVNTTLVKRITAMRLPTTEPGVYRLFARLRQSTGVAGSYQIRYVESVTGGSDIVGDTITFAPATVSWQLVSLGLWQFPTGSPLIQDGLSGRLMQRDTATLGALEVARSVGAGNLDIDYIAAVPAYGDLSFTTANATLSGTVVWDGYSDTESLFASGTVFTSSLYASGAIMSRTGGLPQLWPAQVNRLWYTSSLGIDGTAHDLTVTTTLNVSYWPRFVWLR